jgi:hypothetical protein
MGLFSKPGGAGKPKKAKKPDSKTLIGPTVLVRIQAMVTAASGVARMPKSEEGSKAGSGYVQGLLNATPKKPELKVLAIKRGDEDTTITVGITTPNGQVVNDFTTRGVLTEDNAMATGRSIAYVLKDNAAAVTCGKALLELTKAPAGSQKAFSLGTNRRLMIESGEG